MTTEPEEHESPAEVEMTWQERETLAALRRVARARAQVAALDAPPPGERSPLADADPADVALAHDLEQQIDALRPKARARFGAGGARARIEDLAARQRLVLERLGVADHDALVAAEQAAAAPAEPVDPTAAEFARRELAAAEQALTEVLALEMPPPDPTDGAADDADGPVADVSPLRVHPPAAS